PRLVTLVLARPRPDQIRGLDEPASLPSYLSLGTSAPLVSPAHVRHHSRMLTAIFALVAFAGPPAAEPPPPRPRLVLAGGPLFGPHAAGESTCQVRGGAQRCEHTGNFFGVGANLELRVRLVGPLYIQG